MAAIAKTAVQGTAASSRSHQGKNQCKPKKCANFSTEAKLEIGEKKAIISTVDATSWVYIKLWISKQHMKTQTSLKKFKNYLARSWKLLKIDPKQSVGTQIRQRDKCILHPVHKCNCGLNFTIKNVTNQTDNLLRTEGGREVMLMESCPKLSVSMDTITLKVQSHPSNTWSPAEIAILKLGREI